MKLIPEQSLWWELAEYLPWARNAESLPPWSLRVCKQFWRFLACQQSGSLMITMDQWVFSTRKHEILPRHIFAWYELHDKVAQLSPSCMLACILCALSFLGLHRCAFGHGCINKNGFILQSLWWVLCWIFLLITQCGIFTTMIVEGLRVNLEMFWLSLECSVPEMAGKGFWVWQDAKDASQSRVLECLVCFPSATA